MLERAISGGTVFVHICQIMCEKQKVQTQHGDTNIDERAILRAAQAGDLSSLEILVTRYQDRVYNTILRMCGNADDAAELTQDTFVKAIENITAFRSRSSFYTWVFRIAVNHTLNFCKRRAKITFQSIESAPDESKKRLKDFIEAKASPDPAELVQTKEIYELVLKMLAELGEDQRAVLVLRDIEGMTYSQIADVLDIEQGTVKSRLARARRSLRENLDMVLQ